MQRFKKDEKKKIEGALLRLQKLLRSSPDAAVKIHIHLNRKKGVQLLNDLFALDDTISSASNPVQ